MKLFFKWIKFQLNRTHQSTLKALCLITCQIPEKLKIFISIFETFMIFEPHQKASLWPKFPSPGFFPYLRQYICQGPGPWLILLGPVLGINEQKKKFGNLSSGIGHHFKKLDIFFHTSWHSGLLFSNPLDPLWFKLKKNLLQKEHHLFLLLRWGMRCTCWQHR